MFSRVPGFLELCRSFTHSLLQHSLQHFESSTSSLRRVFRHQLSPDFEPVSVRHSLYQSHASSCGQCQQGVQCVAQRSDEHRSLVGSRWNVRHSLRFCVLQKLHVPLVHKSEVVPELEMELQPGPLTVVIRSRSCSKFQTSAIFVAIESLLRYQAQKFRLRCDPMTMRSRFARHWYVNDLFNDATAWMDNDCGMTWDLMAHVSRCGSSVHVTCRKKN